MDGNGVRTILLALTVSLLLLYMQVGGSEEPRHVARFDVSDFVAFLLALCGVLTVVAWLGAL